LSGPPVIGRSVLFVIAVEIAEGISGPVRISLPAVPKTGNDILAASQ